MKRIGRVDIPQEAFLAVLQVGEDQAEVTLRCDVRTHAVITVHGELWKAHKICFTGDTAGVRRSTRGVQLPSLSLIRNGL